MLSWWFKYVYLNTVYDTVQWRIQVLRLRGATFLGIRIATPSPLERFSWSHYKSICLFFLGFPIAPPLMHFFWSHYKSLYLELYGGKRWGALQHSGHAPWNRRGGGHTSLWKGGLGPSAPPPPGIRPCSTCICDTRRNWTWKRIFLWKCIDIQDYRQDICV